MPNRSTVFLVVEDDDVHAQLVLRGLEKSPVPNRAMRVANGLEALEFLQHHGQYASSPRPDVVLLDLKLPKIDGLRVLSFIKEDELLKTIPVIVMTTSKEEVDRAKAYRYHANSYVVKPMDFEKFRQLVTDLSTYWGVWNEKPNNYSR